MATMFDEVTFTRGPAMANRFMLAPLTNQQSHDDGTLSDDERCWLVRRGEGGFGLTMTCAAHVSPTGQGFPGQLGCFDDAQLPGLRRLATELRATGTVSIVQLHHAGTRSPAELVGQAVAPFDDPSTGARALTTGEIEAVIDDFASAAARVEAAGFDGVEIHGAHGYLLCQFLDAERNQRTDGWGGDLEGRLRIYDAVLQAIRSRCRPDFHVGMRLSPERFGVRMVEVLELGRRLLGGGQLDLLDLSLWDVRKTAADPDYLDTPLLPHFTALDRGATRLAVAGRLYRGEDCQWALDQGADVLAIGRAAITNHDFPELLRQDPAAQMRELPVPVEVLRAESLGEAFITYLRGWPGFVGE